MNKEVPGTWKVGEILFEGTLQKKATSMFAGWQPRYFLICEGGKVDQICPRPETYLVYFKNASEAKKTAQPLAIALLSSIESVTVDKDILTISFSAESHHLKADSPSMAEQWRAALKELREEAAQEAAASAGPAGGAASTPQVRNVNVRTQSHADRGEETKSAEAAAVGGAEETKADPAAAEEPPASLKDKLKRAMKKVDTGTPKSWAKALEKPTVALLEGLAEASPSPLKEALVPLSMVVGGVVKAVQRARANTNQAKILAEQAVDVTLKLDEVVEIIKSSGQDQVNVRARTADKT